VVEGGVGEGGGVLERREKTDFSKGTNWFQGPKLREILHALKRWDDDFW